MSSVCRMVVWQFIRTSHLRLGCYQHLRSWPPTEDRPIQTDAHVNPYHSWRNTHCTTVRQFELRQGQDSPHTGCEAHSASYSLGSFRAKNMARRAADHWTHLASKIRTHGATPPSVVWLRGTTLTCEQEGIYVSSNKHDGTRSKMFKVTHITVSTTICLNTTQYRQCTYT